MEKARVLIIEDNPVDALCVKESLERARGENFAIAQAETLAEAKQYLKEEKFDALVLDLGLPDSQGLETLTQVQDSAPDIPVVVFSGTDDERLAIEAVRSGAQDYLLKDQCDESSLLRAIDFAMERCKLMTKNVGLEALSANREVLGKRIKQSRDAAPTEPSLLKKSRCIPGISDLTSQEVAQVIHELQVYQIELEMQNEELRKSEQDLTELSQKYKDLFDFTSVGYLMLDEKGVIREANLTGANLLQSSASKYAFKQNAEWRW